MSYLHRYVRKYGAMFALAVGCLMIESMADLLLPTVLSQVIDQGVAQSDMDVVWRLGGYMLLITGIGALAACARNILASRVSQAFGTELRSDLYRKIQRLSFDSLDRFDRASLITRLTNDVTQVQNFMNGLMRIFVKAPLLCIGSLIMAVRLNPELSVVLAIVVPVVALLIVWNMRVGFPRYMKVQRALDRVNLVVREYLSGVRVVKAFNRFDYESGKLEEANLEYQSRSIQVMRAMAAFNPAIMLTVNAGILTVLWYGGVRVSNGSMQVGHIVAFINYMTQILFALMMISMVFMMFIRARASSERIGEVFAETDAMRWDPHMETDPSAGGQIEFDHVSFTYGGPDGEPVLKDISFTCKPGETVALIGSTGSGKSTLISLIPRFYDVTEGTIRVNGADISRLDPEKLRKHIALVPQKSTLFSGTIRENILWGREDAQPEEIEEAARIAEAHEFVTCFPEGYETRLGQKGVNLSGGQKQRISIARALIRKPDILILDDSTSAVDVMTEARIKSAIRSLRGRMTCILIAQRITSVADADKIIVLEQGEIAGIGTHAELLRTSRVYREIYQSQMGKEALKHVEAE
ncbi:ABC transporter ATP-binding protein [Gorillibacterium sp. sgz5001074]|uniref:ABC transporter ATP-binding protein n=1 Tax=Gorillibacterium sp. sgz5001074 TaxID=3446695 RepID=UPI003F6778B8